MKIYLNLLVLLFAVQAFAESEAVVDVVLTPAGSFKAKTGQVTGFAEKNGDAVSAKNILVDLKSLKTGISVRDEHTLKYLEAEKFPQAVLVSATGKNGQGEGLLKIKNIEKKVSGKYEIKGSELIAEFPVKLSEFEIKGIRYMGVGVKDEVKLHIVVPLKVAAGIPAKK